MSTSDDHDGIPGGRPRTAQAITVALLIVGLVLAIFVVQNTRPAEIRFLGWSATIPLAAALLLAAVLGGILAGLVVYVRQRQFRKALKATQRNRHESQTSDHRGRGLETPEPPAGAMTDSREG